MGKLIQGEFRTIKSGPMKGYEASSISVPTERLDYLASPEGQREKRVRMMVRVALTRQDTIDEEMQKWWGSLGDALWEDMDPDERDEALLKTVMILEGE